MTIEVVMTADDLGEHGIVWRHGNTYTASDVYALDLIGRGLAYAADKSVADAVRRPTVSVLDFGADRTGVADSTAAFNLATMATTVHGGNDDVAIRRTIEVPPGDYKISGSVYVRNGQHLRGTGEGSTRIMLSGTTSYGDHIFKLGQGLINGTPSPDAGGAIAEISDFWFYGGPESYAVVYCAANGYSIHNLFMTSPGIGITALGDSGRVSSIQLDQGLTGIVVGGQNISFTDVKCYLMNYAVRTAAGVAADISFVNLQVYYSTYGGIEFVNGSLVSDFSVFGGLFMMNEQYTTMAGYVQQRADSANNIVFNNTMFLNSYSLACLHVGAGGNATYNNCTFDGLKTVAGYSQSTNAYAAFIRGSTVNFNNCTFKNLLAAPLYLSGDTPATTVKVRGGVQQNNSGASFIAFASTAPAALSSVTVQGLDGSSALTNTIFGTANRAGWYLGSDAATTLTGGGIATQITTYPVGSRSKYFVNTASAAALVRLPTAADGAALLGDGDSLTFIPYNIAGTTWSTNNVKFQRGASTINGAASDYTVSTNARVTFTYNATTADWIAS
jgi:hypothetical protein